MDMMPSTTQYRCSLASVFPAIWSVAFDLSTILCKSGLDGHVIIGWMAEDGIGTQIDQGKSAR
jgi:hypothetical protein